MAHRLIKAFMAASLLIGTACSDSREAAKTPAPVAAQPAKSSAPATAQPSAPAAAAPTSPAATPAAAHGTAAHAVAATPTPAAEPAPVFELGKDGKRARIDFSLDPNSISVPGMRFSQFANRRLLIFYFSAKCPHCQHAVGYVQKLADELAPQGFTAVAISVKFNTEEEVRGFIRDYKVRMPMFQDAGAFGTGYGTGSIPLVFLVNGSGEYIRYKTFNADSTPNLVKAEAARLASK